MQINMQLFVFGKIYDALAALLCISNGGICTALFPLHVADDEICPLCHKEISFFDRTLRMRALFIGGNDHPIIVSLVVFHILTRIWKHAIKRDPFLAEYMPHPFYRGRGVSVKFPVATDIDLQKRLCFQQFFQQCAKPLVQHLMPVKIAMPEKHHSVYRFDLHRITPLRYARFFTAPI